MGSMNDDLKLDRVEGDLAFTDDEGSDDSAIGWEYHESIDQARQEWLKHNNEEITQRTFNENEIMGDFARDWTGKIIDRERLLKKLYFRDREGHVVNEKGYLIDEDCGDIRSRYSFDVIFESQQLVGLGDCGVELPLPYRIERHNFNPHHCLGNFDFDERDKPIILKDREGRLIDKNLRRVNASGWLTNREDDVIDN